MQVDEKELEIDLYIFEDYLAIETNYKFSLFRNLKSLKGKFSVGKYFFSFPLLEQEACIAHELGHYKNNKRTKKLKYLREMQSWQRQYEGEEPRRYSFERLRKWKILKEISADNQAFEAGYGKPYLIG